MTIFTTKTKKMKLRNDSSLEVCTLGDVKIFDAHIL